MKDNFNKYYLSGLIKIMLLQMFFCNSMIFAQNLQILGAGFNDDVRSLFADTSTNTLFTTGNYTMTGMSPVNHMAKWDGALWTPLAQGSASPIGDYALWNGNIYALGAFWAPFNDTYIAKWNGTGWDSIGRITGGGSLVLTVYSNKLVVAGDFTAINGISIIDVGLWDGNNWVALSNSINWNGSIADAIVYNGNLYICGIFYNNGYNRIAKWNGSSWLQAGTGILGLNSEADHMEVYNNELYVGGYFSKQVGNVGDWIQKWNDTTWTEVGGSVGGGRVWTMTVFQNKLYAGGEFTIAGGAPAGQFASWDGTKWCGYSTDFHTSVENLAVYNNELIFGGGFITCNGDTLRFIAKWIGGNYVDSCGNSTSGIKENVLNENSVTVFPNPANDQITISINVPNFNSEYEIKIYNTIGQEVSSLKTSGKKNEIDVSSLPNGLYFIVISVENSVCSKKLLIQR